MAQSLGRVERRDTYAGYTDLTVEVCTCGVLFAAPTHMLDTKRKNGDNFYCPNGHSLTYGKGSLEKERQRRKQAEERAGRLAHERDQLDASLRAQKAAKTRIRNSRERERKRVAAGVCPCCNRSFKNLGRHMQSQHPDHVESGPE